MSFSIVFVFSNNYFSFFAVIFRCFFLVFLVFCCFSSYFFGCFHFFFVFLK